MRGHFLKEDIEPMVNRVLNGFQNEELLVSQEIAKVLEFFIGSETKALSVSVFDVHSEIPSSKVDSSRTFNSDEFSSIQQPLQSNVKEVNSLKIKR
ncbi:hypothetical protein ACOSP7_020739 [Xanthoceras sorbifolium]